LQRLAATELEVGRGKVEPGAAELRDPDLEGDARPRRGLLEDHPEGSARKKVVLLAPALPLLQVVGQVEHLQKLLATPVGDPREVPALETLRDGCHSACACYSEQT